MSEFLKMGCRQLRPSILMRSCTIALGVYWGLWNYGPGDTTGAGVLLSGQWRNVSLTHWLLITNHWYFSLIIFLERSYFLYHFASYPFTLMCNKKIFKSNQDLSKKLPAPGIKLRPPKDKWKQSIMAGPKLWQKQLIFIGI